MKRTLASFCVLLALAVALGAFGSHGLEERISERYLDIWRTANFYHFVHAIGGMIVVHALHVLGGNKILWISNMFFIGILLFSGSLYLLALWEVFETPELRLMGAVTPFGGVAFMVAWILSAIQFIALYRESGTSPEDDMED